MEMPVDQNYLLECQQEMNEHHSHAMQPSQGILNSKNKVLLMTKK